ncbi:hypothetical protein [Herbidospora daliensis]|uniref:hypothetical protein n=1 Tax=Herbidospora daliensis TaxID=295585 RepID=UPI0007838838|nr:hypothetical protein [Herbidospora daliensis]
MMVLDEAEIREHLAGMARAGAEPVDVIRWLRRELGGNFSEFTLTRYLVGVFDVPFVNVRRAAAWRELPYGAYLSDVEVNELLTPLVVKGGHVESR